MSEIDWIKYAMCFICFNIWTVGTILQPDGHLKIAMGAVAVFYFLGSLSWLYEFFTGG